MANVFFAKGNTSTINQIPIVDGQILFDLQAHIIYVDDNGVREAYAGSDTSSADAISFNPDNTNIVTAEDVQSAIEQLDNKVFLINNNILSINTDITLFKTYTDNMNFTITSTDIDDIEWEN